MVKRFVLVVTAVLLVASLQADAQTTWFKYEGNPVLNAGPAGSWEERGILAGSVLRPDSIYQMWYGGMNANFTGRIGHASSPDGIIWSKDSSNPVMSATYNWEGSVNAFPCVLFDGAKYKMWYTGNSHVGYATSADGRTGWTKSSTPVLSPGSGWDAASANGPWVLDTIGGFKMWYTAYRGYELAMIGYATGDSGAVWTKYQNAVVGPGISGSWDEREVTFPKVLQDGQTYHMWFAGTKVGIEYNQCGYAVSSDGKHWTKDSANPVIAVGPSGSWDQTGVTPGGVINAGGLYHMWYSGNDGAHYRIGYAVSPKGFKFLSPPKDTVLSTQDTVMVTLRIDVPDHHLSFLAFLVCSDFDYAGGHVDTLQLHDDGLHGDNLASDGLYANRWHPATDGNYRAEVSLTLNDTARFNAIPNLTQFVVPVAESQIEVPTRFALEQNYPNPFNPTTGIRFQMPGVSNVKLTVYDLMGREVAVLVDEKKAPGSYEVSFDGSRLSSGVYFYRLVAGSFVSTKKMLVLK
jgi:predicted GH43/DUF377 family glycosyl hydrolase